MKCFIMLLINLSIIIHRKNIYINFLKKYYYNYNENLFHSLNIFIAFPCLSRISILCLLEAATKQIGVISRRIFCSKIKAVHSYPK